MSWNYRVIHRIHKAPKRLGGKTHWYGVHEVYYDEEGKPNGCVIDPAELGSTTLTGLQEVKMMMSMALKHPILEWSDFEKMEKKSEKERAVGAMPTA